MPPHSSGRNICSAAFFVLRTPLLPFDELLRWARDLETPHLMASAHAGAVLDDAWRRDAAVLRSRLREVIDRPEIRHALFFASPTLDAGIAHWSADPSSKKGVQAERALVRYFTRMSSRSTPFGLFAGCSTGKVSVTQTTDDTVLVLRRWSENKVSSRLDYDYLFELAGHLRREPNLQNELRYFPNDSLRKGADSWNYVECRLADSDRTHYLSRIQSDSYVDFILEKAKFGYSIPNLSKSLLEHPLGQGLAEQDVRDFLQQLIDNDVLVSDLRPPVTGDSPIDGIISELSSVPSGRATAQQLASIREELAELDVQQAGVATEGYRVLAERIASELPGKINPGRLYQVDMIKPTPDATLSHAVVEEILAGVCALHRLDKIQEPEVLKQFRQAFIARYDRAQVPLLEALDEEFGVGFGEPSRSASPLLREIRMTGENKKLNPARTLSALLTEKIAGLTAEYDSELSISTAELATFGEEELALPDSFAVVATLVSRSVELLRSGEFTIVLNQAYGPDGARFMARFCHADPKLKEHVRSYLEAEEANNPNAIYAEIIYLPEGRAGNVLCRPVLRKFELAYLGRSGAPVERVLPANDLLVSIERGHIQLYSQRLGRQVIPRLTSAHAFMAPQFDRVYQFLCYLQNQHGVGIPTFSWGSLAAIDFLPRVRIGRLVVTRARWRLRQNEVDRLTGCLGSHRYLAVQKLRDVRRLPRWIVLSEGDNDLHVDLDNVLSVDSFVHVLGRRHEAVLHEMYPAPEELLVTGPEGRFQHEIVLPFFRQVTRTHMSRPVEAQSVKPTSTRSIEKISRCDRAFSLGSEWLYIKLYGGISALSDILLTTIRSLSEDCLKQNLVSRWFFVWYADPLNHIRLRFNGPDRGCMKGVIERVHAAFDPFLMSNKLWKIQFDTYEREVERYGGLKSMEITEDVFFVDSEAVLEIRRHYQGDEHSDRFWRIALIGIDSLLNDFGFSLDLKHNVVGQWRDGWRARLNTETETLKSITDKFRKERRSLETAIESLECDDDLKFARQTFASRSRSISHHVSRIRNCEQRGELQVDMAELAGSYVHMHLNRLFPGSPNQHELVLYDFLFRLYEAQSARKRRSAVRYDAGPRVRLSDAKLGNGAI